MLCPAPKRDWVLYVLEKDKWSTRMHTPHKSDRPPLDYVYTSVQLISIALVILNDYN